MGAYKDTRYPTCFLVQKLSPKANGAVLKKIPASVWASVVTGPASCVLSCCDKTTAPTFFPLSRLNELSTEHFPCSEELANRTAKDPKLSNISITSLDPGTMPVLSEISVRFSPNGILRPSWKSAADIIRACFDIKAHKGKALYLDGTAGFQIAKDARDEAKRKDLWEYGLLAAKIEEGDTALVNWR